MAERRAAIDDYLSEWRANVAAVQKAFPHLGESDAVALHDLARALSVAPRDEALALAYAFLEEFRAGPPPGAMFGDVRQDAEWWADCALPAEVEAVVAAGLRRIERTQFGAAARKRIFVALWETMKPDDRRAFLVRVDPGGKFRGKA